MHWSDAYRGRKHIPLKQDCAQLIIDVQRVEFDRIIHLPIDRETGDVNSVAATALLVETTTPVEGDIVLLKATNAGYHVGIYTIINNKPYVLHSLEEAGVCLHKLSDFGTSLLFNLKVSAFFSFQAPEINTGTEEGRNDELGIDSRSERSRSVYG